MSGISDRVGSPVAPPATAATPMTRRPSDDALPSEAAPQPETTRRPGSPGARYSAGAPDPSGRSGGLVDVFA